MFQVSSMQRWQYPIDNGTLEPLIWSILWKILSFFQVWFILIILQFDARKSVENNQFFKSINFLI